MHNRSFAIMRSRVLPVLIASLFMVGWLSVGQCQEPEKASIPDLNGTWTGTLTGKTRHPKVCGTADLSMTFDQVVGKSTFTGSYILRPSATCSGGTGDLTGSVTRKGVVKITADNGTDCTTDMVGHVDDAVTEITGSFKLSSGCSSKERGGTGSFDVSL